MSQVLLNSPVLKFKFLRFFQTGFETDFDTDLTSVISRWITEQDLTFVLAWILYLLGTRCKWTPIYEDNPQGDNLTSPNQGFSTNPILPPFISFYYTMNLICIVFYE